ncbi:hypothetical protein B0O99DRAFT_646047 [Bisporella sp. PMI_857]|nr:hypothetical protein B0O99DRAFT_646047 [Bisporella sp. PMI_857]
METVPRSDRATNASKSKIFISVALLLAVIAAIILVAWIVHRIRPPVIAPAILRNERMREEERHRKETENCVLESLPVVQYGIRLQQECGSKAHSSAQSTCPPKRQFRSTVDQEESLHISADPVIITGADSLQEETTVDNSVTPDSRIRIPRKEHVLPNIYPPGSRPEPTSCSVCTEDFVESENVRILHCGHIYHQRCIDPWVLEYAGTCPLCRITLRNAAIRREVE